MSKLNILLIFGVVLLMGAWVVFKNLMRRRLERNQGAFEDPDSERRVRQDLESLIAQVQDITREQIAKADVKIRMLNQLLAESEERKKELETLLGRALAVQRGEPVLAKPAEPKKPANPLHEQVYSLQDQGKAVPEICSATGLEIGEVEMILGLRKIR